MTAAAGLEGIVATTSSISSIIDDTLTYVGYNIDDLTENASFEEVIYLLWHLELPNSEQLQELKQQLADNMELPAELIESFKTYPIDKVHPMAALVQLFQPWDFMTMKQMLWIKKLTTAKRFAYKPKCLQL